jgi:GNAT superfamily N-acetyltransferase
MIEDLTSKDLPSLLDLQSRVVADLKSKNKLHYIVPRTADYFKEHLSSPHKIIGLKDNGVFIAQAIYHNKKSFIAKDDIGLKHLARIQHNDSISILQGALVDPDFQGQGLMKKIIEHWMLWAQNNGYHHALARTEVSHKASQNSFFHHGFDIVDTIIDARDGASVHVLYRSLTKERL